MTAVLKVGEAEQAVLRAGSRLKDAARLVLANVLACWQVLRQRLRPDMKTVQEQQQPRQQQRACVFQQELPQKATRTEVSRRKTRFYTSLMRGCGVGTRVIATTCSPEVKQSQTIPLYVAYGLIENKQ
jgi:hypothetical protein